MLCISPQHLYVIICHKYSEFRSESKQIYRPGSIFKNEIRNQKYKQTCYKFI